MSHDVRLTWQAEGGRLTAGLQGVSAKEVAEKVPGPSTRELGMWAKELGIYLTVPLLEIEKPTGKLFNSLVLMGPDGSLLLHYRKLNPWPWAERGWAAVGDRGHQVIETPLGRFENEWDASSFNLFVGVMVYPFR